MTHGCGKMFRRVHSRYHGVCLDATKKQPWRTRFVVRGRLYSLLRFYEEEDAARFSDVARRFLNPGAPLNFDGQPPTGWTHNDVLRYLVERGLVDIATLGRILAGVQVSENGEISPRGTFGG